MKIKTSIKSVIDYIINPNTRPDWDSSVTRSNVVKRLSDSMSLVRTVFKKYIVLKKPDDVSLIMKLYDLEDE